MAETSPAAPLTQPKPYAAEVAARRAYALGVAIRSVCNEIGLLVEAAYDRANFVDRDPDFRQEIEFDEPYAEDLAAVLPQLIVLFNAHLNDMRLAGVQ